MFAGEKLLCEPFSTSEDFVRNLTDIEKMACMTIRIPLEFTTRTLHSQNMERTLVEKHMHICLRVEPGFEAAVTVTPSKLILAEASHHLMRSSAFKFPQIAYLRSWSILGLIKEAEVSLLS